ncbi:MULTISPECIES: aminotransferase class I/II-fold pyridoxal phosphate-dependent enzyme [Streptomyces]|uniref:8-amino-7-oxononanoate synthase n=2 Tax=Streptomyces TaxID=1883 RepID=A0ABW9INM4_STRGJ|nr:MULTISPECIES: aminotransferase class I/II-fold pyridoxal phosphate-dependent enzyme [Streptomyces]QEU63963.1 aminotransferase class I/II-fold pyridoxal phosphate-dependent enzyme [Streptomyces galilaeus]GGW75794.1 2-amino-3-ketobutyrate CoA ligase [Streptomyces galilaeus]
MSAIQALSQRGNPTDLYSRFSSFTAARDLMAADLYPFFLPLEGGEGPTVRRDGRTLIMCGSNNYLGLTGHPEVLAAARSALDRYGSSRTGSRFLNGNTDLHQELEAELADYLGKPAALVMSTGYQTNLGVLGTVLTPRDYVVLDRSAHASLLDGCRLSGAKVRWFPHNDPEGLRRTLERIPDEAGRLVVVDGVYSMEGDVCDLPAVVKMCSAYGARLLLDDAHGLGVLAEGRGTAAHFGLTDEVDLITVTFSKSLASLGGAVAGSEEAIHYLRHHARSLMFSASTTPTNAAAALAALRLLRARPELATAVQANAAYVRRGLAEAGVRSTPSSTPIVSLPTPGALETLTTWQRLLHDGVYVNPVLPPAAEPRLRTSYMASHTLDQLDRVVEACAAQDALLERPGNEGRSVSVA